MRYSEDHKAKTHQRIIEEAALRFDLSPSDEEFLLQHCREPSIKPPPAQ